MKSITTLNDEYGRGEKLVFSEGNGGLRKLELCYKKASVELYLQGAHITSYKSDPDNEILWMSKSALFETGKAIRGGIPLCWPWFGSHPDNPDAPQHGFARINEFSVLSTAADTDNTTIILSLSPGNPTFSDWKSRARLEVEIRLSDSLWMEMRTLNDSVKPLTVSNALHTYYSISQRGRVLIPELTGLTYLDKPRNYKQMKQSSPIRIDGEIDRVYQTPPPNIVLHDSDRRTSLSLGTWGNSHIVVWNPGEVKAKKMSDFDDCGFENMLCIEPANALDQTVSINPHECHHLGQQISFLDAE